MPKYDSDTIPCCVTCDTRSETKSCIKCAVVFCRHYASAIDIRFCANCIGEVAVKESILEKVIEHTKPDGTISFSRKFQSKMIKLEGVDWLFANHLIEDMTDAEIDGAVEYHRANVDLMLMERESRKQERIRKLASVKVISVKRQSQYEKERAEAKASSPKKTKTKEITQNDLVAALMQLAKAGLTPEQITAMVAKGGKK